LKVIVVGLGVQGAKRRAVAKDEFVAAVDPANQEAQYRTLQEVPTDQYDAALVCTPDQPKLELLEYLLSRGKHVLVEKPLWAPRDEDIERLGRLARDHQAVCYTAYNHRFEPHYLRMREVIASGALGSRTTAECSTETGRPAWCANRRGATRGLAFCRTWVRICSIPRLSGSAIWAAIFRCISPAASRTVPRIIWSLVPAPRGHSCNWR